MTRVVGFSGLAGSGKTTAAEMLLEEASKQGMTSCRLSFAHALRQICMIAYPWVPREYFCGNKTQKETQIPGMPEGTTGRRILQRIGTDAFRSIYQDTWIRLVQHQIEKSQDLDLIVLDDVRFPNELEMLKRIGAVTLRCNRAPEVWRTQPRVELSDGGSRYVLGEPTYVGTYKPAEPLLIDTGGTTTHESEAHVASLPVDIDIDNNGTLDELAAQIRPLLRA